jgi:hypothetical protein
VSACAIKINTKYYRIEGRKGCMTFQAITLAKQGNVNIIPLLSCSYLGTPSGEAMLSSMTTEKIIEDFKKLKLL